MGRSPFQSRLFEFDALESIFKSFLALNSRERFQEFFSFSSSSSSWSIGRDRLQWILDRDRGSKVCVVWQREGTNETLF